MFLHARQRYCRPFDGAMRLFDETIAWRRTFARPYNYARPSRRSRQTRAALAWLQRGLPGRSDSWRTTELGKLLWISSAIPEAEMHLERPCSSSVTRGGAGLARVLYAQGKYDDFVREARTALGLPGELEGTRPRGARLPREVRTLGPAWPCHRLPIPNIIGWNYD